MQTVVITIMTLLAPQMITNLRRKYYKYTPGVGTEADILPGGVSFQSQDLSWNAQFPGSSDSITIDASVLDYWIPLPLLFKKRREFYWVFWNSSMRAFGFLCEKKSTSVVDNSIGNGCYSYWYIRITVWWMFATSKSPVQRVSLRDTKKIWNPNMPLDIKGTP